MGVASVWACRNVQANQLGSHEPETLKIRVITGRGQIKPNSFTWVWAQGTKTEIQKALTNPFARVKPSELRSDRPMDDKFRTHGSKSSKVKPSHQSRTCHLFKPLHMCLPSAMSNGRYDIAAGDAIVACMLHRVVVVDDVLYTDWSVTNSALSVPAVSPECAYPCIMLINVYF